MRLRTYLNTNKSLKRTYDQINRELFGKRLPENVNVRYGDLGRDMGEAICADEITINYRLKPWPKVVVMTLIHECCHVALPISVTHGEKFQKLMKRFAKKNVFEDLW